MRRTVLPLVIVAALFGCGGIVVEEAPDGGDASTDETLATPSPTAATVAPTLADAGTPPLSPIESSAR